MKHKLRRVLTFTCLSVIFIFDIGLCSAADFPEKPVKFIVAFAAGSGIDMEARGIAPYIQKHLGVPVTVENVSGADGKIGLTRVWKAKPDGYTLILHTTTMSLIGEYLLNPEYKISDFSQIFSWSLTNYALVVNSETWKTMDEFIKAARERALSVGMAGRGSTAHLNGLILADGMDIKTNWVPFDGATDALTSLAGKHIDFVICGTTTALPLVKAGKLRVLAVVANKKDLVFPDIPMAKDFGYNFTVIPALRGVDGPPKMEVSIIKTIEQAFAKAIKEPEYLVWAQRRMIDIVPLNHEEYRQSIRIQQKGIEKYIPMFKTDK